MAMVTLTALITPNGQGGQIGIMSFAVTGATSIVANDATALRCNRYGYQISATYLVTGLGAGSNTFTASYRTISTANVAFANRNIIVVPVP